MPITPDISSVNTHLTNLQTIVGRMATYSSTCKQLCTTVVSAILVLAIDKAKTEATIVGFISIVIFFILDSYYLSLERDFRKLYDTFVEKLHSGTADSLVYTINLPASGAHRTKEALKSVWSVSTFFFYGILTIAVMAVKFYVQSLPADLSK